LIGVGLLSYFSIFPVTFGGVSSKFIALIILCLRPSFFLGGIKRRPLQASALIFIISLGFLFLIIPSLAVSILISVTIGLVLRKALLDFHGDFFKVTYLSYLVFLAIGIMSVLVPELRKLLLSFEGSLLSKDVLNFKAIGFGVQTFQASFFLSLIFLIRVFYKRGSLALNIVIHLSTIIYAITPVIFSLVLSLGASILKNRGFRAAVSPRRIILGTLVFSAALSFFLLSEATSYYLKIVVGVIFGGVDSYASSKSLAFQFKNFPYSDFLISFRGLEGQTTFIGAQFYDSGYHRLLFSGGVLGLLFFILCSISSLFLVLKDGKICLLISLFFLLCLFKGLTVLPLFVYMLNPLRVNERRPI
jgi:hypothetical protein